MIDVYSKIMIVKSKALTAIKLDALTDKTGVVLEKLCDKQRKNKGYMIHLDEPFESEFVWFVPLESVKENDKN